jgi:hypothetical protein
MSNTLLIRTVQALQLFIGDSTDPPREPIRRGHAAVALLFAGAKHTATFDHVLIYFSKTQFKDGGWADPEETAWAAGFISLTKGGNVPSISAAIQWLKANRLDGGGWGRHSRDRARIPTTALVLSLVPEAGSDEDYELVAREWAKDLKGSVQLSYKAGFYLLVAGHASIQGDSELIDRTIRHLINDQNDDGGFAPWKNHPIGSDPWSTGVVLWGLSKWIDRVDPAVIERALHWLEVTQLPSGYWPYHYLDEGTSYALIGAVSAMRAMASRK